MASADNSKTVDSTGETIFDRTTDGGYCSEFSVGVRTTSDNPALVNIPGLHASGEFYGLPVGAAITFGLGENGLGSVFAKGDGGDALIDFGIVSKF